MFKYVIVASNIILEISLIKLSRYKLKYYLAIMLFVFASNTNAGAVTIIGKSTYIEVTNRLFLKSMTLSILLTAKAMNKELEFKVHDFFCSDI